MPFLVEPQIELKSLRQLPSKGGAPRRWQWPWLPDASAGSSRSSSSTGSGARERSSRGSRGSSPSSASSSSSSSSSNGAAEGTRLFAEWRLTCYVRLPWAPFVEVNGTTTYTLNSEKNQVCSCAAVGTVGKAVRFPVWPYLQHSHAVGARLPMPMPVLSAQSCPILL